MKKLYLGIDVGGSKVRGVLWDGRRVLSSREFKTPRSMAAFGRMIRSLVAQLVRWAKEPIRGIGIGAAGVIGGTRLRVSPNIPYLKKFDFTALHLPVPFRLDNDARAFCRAEARIGAGKGSRRILACTIGTGIGRAYSDGGRVRMIKRFEYPERWEKTYQRVRDRGVTPALAAFLGEKLGGFVRRYRPDVFVLGGGVLGRPKMLGMLKAELRRRGVNATLRRGRLGPNAAAIGAALLFGRRR